LLQSLLVPGSFSAAGQMQTLLVVPEPEPGDKVLTKSDTHSKSTGKWKRVLGKAVRYKEVTKTT
ncbi:hypothetical protein STEG23_013855, partial [Scotinomys teguina]